MLPEPLPDMEARELVREISLGRIDPTDKQLKAALALMGDDTKRVLGAGKKDAKNEAAKTAASKFGAAPPPPRMVVNNGR
ncbi:terminase small subunit [Burkholderia sp. WP9]|uniref:terminase small subunit n=1 Tax=Burkholderia sp. WP9 TaxID=1500263 RepID=UPI00115FE078|nr:terminase small subunit [Burkholderia sp. WP9]